MSHANPSSASARDSVRHNSFRRTNPAVRQEIKVELRKFGPRVGRPRATNNWPADSELPASCRRSHTNASTQSLERTAAAASHR